MAKAEEMTPGNEVGPFAWEFFFLPESMGVEAIKVFILTFKSCKL